MRISSIHNSIDQLITRLARITLRLVSVLGAPTVVNVVDLRASLCSHALLWKDLPRFERRGIYAARVLNASSVGSQNTFAICRFRSLAEFIPTHAARLYERPDETIKKHPLRHARREAESSDSIHQRDAMNHGRRAAERPSRHLVSAGNSASGWRCRVPSPMPYSEN